MTADIKLIVIKHGDIGYGVSTGKGSFHNGIPDIFQIIYVNIPIVIHIDILIQHFNLLGYGIGRVIDQADKFVVKPVKVGAKQQKNEKEYNTKATHDFTYPF